MDDQDAESCAEAVWNLRSVLDEELKKQGMSELYYKIELPLCKVLYKMEKIGVAIDKEQLQQFMTDELDPLGRQIIELVMQDAPLEKYLELTPMNLR